jgi:hypothetical protein
VTGVGATVGVTARLSRGVGVATAAVAVATGDLGDGSGRATGAHAVNKKTAAIAIRTSRR